MSIRFTRIHTPWHLWAIGGISLLWNAMGAFDYVMTQTKNASYLEMFTPEQLEYFTSFPSWVVASWATAIWTAVLGSVLLLMRRRLAVFAFSVSFVAMVVTALHNFVLSSPNMIDISGVGAGVFSLAIFVVSALLLLYARGMRRGGVLT